MHLFTNNDPPIQNLDLFAPQQFEFALKTLYSRPFTFGPIIFDHLNQQIDFVEARQQVIDKLESSDKVSSPGANIFVHGYRVTVKDRTLKRGSSLLKHGRFLANLEVQAVHPQPAVPVDEENESVSHIEDDY